MCQLSVFYRNMTSWRRARGLRSTVMAVALLVTASAALAWGPFGPETCKQGFVWREACSPDDHVCVLPAVRTQAAQDDAQAASRRAGSGPFGPDTCKQGFVWREACSHQDHVCVTPATRSAAAADNAKAASRFAATPRLWDVLTQHQDAARSGAQVNETILTPANVKAGSFGRIAERHVEGQVIAQPLYVSNQWDRTKGLRNVVYVATRANWVYAFDADNTDPDPNAGLIWAHPVQVAASSPVPNMCSETVGPLGITATPVIDRNNDTMYLTARHSDGTIWLHALDIATGSPKAGTPGEVQITGAGFNQALELSRAGLLLQNGAIFVGFSALNCDNPGWSGWVFAYRAPDLQLVGSYRTTQNGATGAGIWASGNGLVGDGQNVYFQTGNRGSGAAADALDESFIKLKVGAAPGYGLTLAGHYTVTNREVLNGGDTDLGSGGPLLLDGKRLVGGGKQGKLYVLDPASMAPTQNGPTGGTVAGGSDGFQAFLNTWHDNTGDPACTDVSLLERHCFMAHDRYDESEMTGPNIHTAPIYWRQAPGGAGLLYGMAEKDFLRSYAFDHTHLSLATSAHAVSHVRSPDGMPGSFLSLSANGGSQGIVWAQVPNVDSQWQNGPGHLVAFDALTLNELWRDSDDLGFAKFNPPTVAGGKVFRPTFANKLIIYGLKSGPDPTPCYTIDQKYENYTGDAGLLGAATGAESVAPDGVGHYRHYQGGSIYWTPTTCAWEVHGSIQGEWQATGWEAGVLGYPTTDETPTPDGRGRYNHFQQGSIYWTPTTGAHEVHGLIHAKWASLGWETSALGYPISDETDEVDGSGRFSTFEHGTIHWNRSTNAVTVIDNAAILLTPLVGGEDRLGSDYTHFNLPAATPAMCQQKCADDGLCQAWTMVNPGVQGPSAICYLKNATPLRSNNGCCTSGLKIDVHPAGYTAMSGRIDLPGSDYTDFDLPTADAELCQGECAHNASCKAWTYKEPWTDAAKVFHLQHCWFKNALPAQVNNGLTISGHR